MSERYLTFDPWRGLMSNTRMCFETAATLAFLTGRTLVLPAWYRERQETEGVGQTYRPIHPEAYLDFKALHAGIPVISDAEFHKREVGAGAVLPRFTTDTSVLCWPNVPAAGSPESERLASFAAGRPNVFALDAEANRAAVLHMPQQLEHFYTFIFCCDPADEASARRFVRDHVGYKPEVMATGRGIADAIGGFSALHIRRGPYNWMLDYPQSCPDAGAILHKTSMRVPPGSRLYIATDEADMRFFDPIAERYDILTLKDVRRIFPPMNDDCVAATEQVICSHAKTFIGTRLSSFSSYITRLRGYNVSPDTGVHFTTQDAGSDADGGAYSWEAWASRREPLWGREFREGWQVA